MSSSSCDCSHINQIDDVNSGDNVCTDCGTVLDKIFIFPDKDVNQERNFKNLSSNDEFLAEMLEKLHLPGYIAKHVYSELSNTRGPHYSYSNLSLTRGLYQTLAKLGVAISAKDLCAVSGFSSKKILNTSQVRENKLPGSCNDTSEIVCLKIDDILERLCGKLGISYRDCTVIKKSVAVRYSGFNPNTVASAYIYLYCRKNLKKIKLKAICEVSGISCMSVHRFIKKNDLSFRT
jgi:transcription initiation factor TFIIIB Brf1 subunit/transcription initiation factor TFIIB